MSNVMFSSETDLWSTPDKLFDILNSLFNFDIDVCATHENAKCKNYYTKEIDGLNQNWIGTCWMNPPYGRTIGDWVKKAHESSKINNHIIVALLPARVDTKWWHLYCKDHETYFIKGRLKFGNSNNNAPFPSAIVIFRNKVDGVLQDAGFI